MKFEDKHKTVTVTMTYREAEQIDAQLTQLLLDREALEKCGIKIEKATEKLQKILDEYTNT